MKFISVRQFIKYRLFVTRDMTREFSLYLRAECRIIYSLLHFLFHFSTVSEFINCNHAKYTDMQNWILCTLNFGTYCLMITDLTIIVSPHIVQAIDVPFSPPQPGDQLNCLRTHSLPLHWRHTTASKSALRRIDKWTVHMATLIEFRWNGKVATCTCRI